MKIVLLLNLVLSFSVVCLIGCSKAPVPETAKTFIKILAIDQVDQKVALRVKASEIEEVRNMDAKVSRGDLELLEVGSTVRGNLVQSDGAWLLDSLWPDDPSSWNLVHQYGEKLRRDTSIRGRNAYREIGEFLPDFALFSSNGGILKKEDLIGKVVVLNFIFTRCRNPNMCPSATRNMKELQDLAEKHQLQDVMFCSVTFDPEYDTPGTLRNYGHSYGIDFSNFAFLTGPIDIIKNLQKQCGILVKPDEEDILDHTMRCMLIDRSGKIVYHVPGTYFNAEDFIREMTKVAR